MIKYIQSAVVLFILLCFAPITAMAQHYSTVWENNPFKPMHIVLTHLSVDSLPASVGDEIALFDTDGLGNSICVAVATLVDTVSLSNPIVLIASSDDPTTEAIDGYTEGDTLIFKLWSGASQEECALYQAVFHPELDSVYTALETAVVQINFTKYQTQLLEFDEGWNLTSWYVIPENENMQELLSPLINNSQLIKSINQNGDILQQMPWGWVNSIGNMANTEGYQIKVAEPCTLSTTGFIVALPMDIPFISGWNLMGWPAQSAEDAQTAFTSLINTNHLVKVIDQSGNILQQLPWGWVNNIGSLSPGQGYQVKVSSNCAITINQPVGDNILAPIKMPPTRFMRSQQKGNPYNPMTFALRNNDNLPQNTEIGVYYSDKCYGAEVLTGDYIYITAGMDEVDTEEKEGFGAGEAFHFKYITEGMQEAQELEVAYIEGDKSFLERGTFVGEIKSVLAADELQATASWIGDAHPNPTRNEVFVDLSLAEPSILYLSLMDSHGKIVLEERTEKQEGAQRQRINLSEFSPGVYFLKIQIENESAYQEKVLRIVRM